MEIPLFSKAEMKAMDDLKSSYGGAKKIAQAIEVTRNYEYRKAALEKKGFSQFLRDASSFAKRFPRTAEYKPAKGAKSNKGVATTQVSAWQGARISHNCFKRMAENGQVFAPYKMISMMAMTEEYVHGGDLMATLAMCENIMGARLCSANLIGVPLPTQRFDHIKKVTGVKLDTTDAGNGLRVACIKNMGTAFGNMCGIEVSNDNHLLYLDNMTRAAMTTGANFFLNPSWSTIMAACYYAKDIPGISFKISMFLSTQNLMMFRMILNIIEEYRRKDGTTPIAEINLGNAVAPEKFIECHNLLNKHKLDIALAAHIRINSDLGVTNFNWFDNAVKVLESGHDVVIKYESDGECRPYDTVASYFMPQDERESKTETLGEVLYHKVARCDKDAKALMKMGFEVKFAGVAEKNC